MNKWEGRAQDRHSCPALDLDTTWNLWNSGFGHKVTGRQALPVVRVAGDDVWESGLQMKGW